MDSPIDVDTREVLISGHEEIGRTNYGGIQSRIVTRITDFEQARPRVQRRHHCLQEKAQKHILQRADTVRPFTCYYSTGFIDAECAQQQDVASGAR